MPSRDSRITEGIALWFFWRRVAERTRGAEREAESAPRPGVWNIIAGTWRRASAHNIAIVAAGVAFYGFLSIFPALTAAVSIYGLISDPADLQAQLDALAGVVPRETLDNILSQQMSAVARSSDAALSLGALAGIMLTLWSAKRAMDAAISSLNIVYGVEETRGVVRLNLFSLVLSLAVILGGLVVVALLVIVPAILPAILERIPGVNESWAWFRWPVLIVAVILALAVLYRIAPNRANPRWRAIFPGAVLASALWLAVSALFSIYAANFGSYNETYGSLSAVVVLMLWLSFSCYVVLLGAEFNAEREAHLNLDLSKILPPASDL